MRRCCWERFDNCFGMRGLLKIFIFAIAMLLPCMVMGQDKVKAEFEKRPFSEFKGKQISYFIDKIKKQKGILALKEPGGLA